VFQPTRAYFGQKDAQQVVVIRRMVADLDFNLQVIVCPTIREPDGLAMSSRNVRLTPEHRRQAASLHEALLAAEKACRSGHRDGELLKKTMREIIAAVPDARIDYVSAADPETLEELDAVTSGVLFSLAVHFGAVRLIDNLMLEKI
jgi:pantoate--beta-alanine ligase